MPYFTQARNVELSTISHLETQIAANWSGITVVKSFSQTYAKNVKLPVVCIRITSQASRRQEIGTTTLWNEYNIIIDIFAKSGGQRIDLAYYITDLLKDNWTYYIYSHASGDKTTLDSVADGKIKIENYVSNTMLEFSDSTESKDRFRHYLEISVRKST